MYVFLFVKVVAMVKFTVNFCCLCLFVCESGCYGEVYCQLLLFVFLFVRVVAMVKFTVNWSPPQTVVSNPCRLIIYQERNV